MMSRMGRGTSRALTQSMAQDRRGMLLRLAVWALAGLAAAWLLLGPAPAKAEQDCLGGKWGAYQVTGDREAWLFSRIEVNPGANLAVLYERGSGGSPGMRGPQLGSSGTLRAKDAKADCKDVRVTGSFYDKVRNFHLQLSGKLTDPLKLELDWVMNRQGENPARGKVTFMKMD